MNYYKMTVIAGALVASLTACPNDGLTNQATSYLTGGVLKGQFNNWTRGERSIRALQLLQSGVQVLAQGTIATTGEFSMALPSNPTTLSGVNFSSGCSPASTISVSATNIQGAGLAGFDVLKATNTITGTAQHQSNNTTRILYIFVNKDVNVSGNCLTNTETISFALQFKQGWNRFVQTQTSSTQFRLATEALPNGTSWSYVPRQGGNINLTAPTDVLEVGTTLALQAQATDAEGDPIPASRINWSSGTPDLASVDTAGVVTAKQLGLEFTPNPTVSIKATIDNDISTTKEVTLKLYGFRVTGGTFNTGAVALGTAAKVSYILSTGSEPTTGFSYTITGPSGWNNNQPLTGMYKPRTAEDINNGFVNFFVSETPAIAGTYTLRANSAINPTFSSAKNTISPFVSSFGLQQLIAQNTGLGTIAQPGLVQQANNQGVSFTINASSKRELLKNAYLKSISRQPSGVNAKIEWDYNYDGVAQAEAFNLTDNVVEARFAAGSSNADFASLQLNNNKNYVAYIYVRPSSGGFAANSFDVSRVSVPLTLKPQIRSLSANGGVSSGGYPLEIKGLGFDINTLIHIGNTVVSTFTLVDNSTLRLTVPTGTAGEVDVKVTTSEGTSDPSAATKFRYYAGAEFARGNVSLLHRYNDGRIGFIENTAAIPWGLVRMNDLGQVSSTTDLSGTGAPSAVAVDSNNNTWVLGNPYGSAIPTIVKVASDGTQSTVNIPNGIRAIKIAIGSDNNIWIAHYNEAKISRFTQNGTDLATFVVPTTGCCGGQIGEANDMVLGADGNIWFTVAYGQIGRVTPLGGIVTFNISPSGQKLSPLDNVVWMASGSSAVKIASDGTFTTFNSQCNDAKIARANDNAYWCPGSSFGSLGTNLIRYSNNWTEMQRISLVATQYVFGVRDFVGSTTGKMWYIADGSTVNYVQP